eukprot:g27709.t1
MFTCQDCFIELRLRRERSETSITEEDWQSSAGGALYRRVRLECPLWQRLWSGLEAEQEGTPATFVLSQKEIRLLREVELHVTCCLMHLGHASSHLHSAGGPSCFFREGPMKAFGYVQESVQMLQKYAGKETLPGPHQDTEEPAPEGGGSTLALVAPPLRLSRTFRKGSKELSGEEEKEEKVMMHPQSRRRLIWDSISVFMISVDIVMLPMIYGMGISEVAEVVVVEWICTLFWSVAASAVDMFITFLTGYTVGPDVIMSPRKVAIHYLTTWFAVDFAIVGSEWASRITEFVAGFNAFRAARAVRVLRVVRVVRLIRLARFVKTVQKFTEMTGSLRLLILFNVLKLTLFLLLAAWSFSGKSARCERAACFTLIFMSIFVSSLTSRMLQLQQLMDKESGYKRLLQRYNEMHSLSYTTPSLKSLLRKGDLLVAPGVFDGISTRLAEQVGFKALYMTGFGTVGSHLGLPDAGLASYRDMVERVRTLSALTSAPLICDGDTGFGGLLNVDHTVKGYEAAGASAIQLEDQEFPKKCGHTPNRKVIPFEQAVAKIRVAVEARSSPDFLIIARTDARTALGLDEALRRAKAFAAAGADVLFVEAPESEAEMQTICSSLAETGKPLLVNCVEGGKTPLLSKERYIELGYQLAIYPATGFLAMGQALTKVYRSLSDHGDSGTVRSDLTDFKGFCVSMGFQQVWDFEPWHQ